VKPEQSSKDSASVVTGPEVDAELEYENTILSMSVSLSSAGLQKENLNIVPMLYERLPLQCNQCAQRFPAGQAGKKRMGEHLDQHFRQNRKANQGTGQGRCRSWFVGVDDWVHDGHESGTGKGKGRADAPKAAAAAAAEREAKLRASFVIVPPGEEAQPKVCPICKEVLKAEFIEEDEEWVWKNATNIKNTIYHATCHADALLPRIAARLKDKTGRSRSATPESSRTPQPGGSPRTSGVKRKAEEDGINVKLESPESTPPQKKQAISS
jgi:pre-mRNA cleavage complex 2 protein Pcf11